MQYTITNGTLCLTVDEFGAEPISIMHNGKEWLWQNQTGAWSGHAPILFPFCGNCQLWVDGKHYEMNRHGFARISQFSLAKQTSNSLEFVLASNDNTKKAYPFDFELTAIYTIDGDTLAINYEIANTGNTPLYYACGGHESFYLEDGYANYKLVFDKDEQFVSLCNNNDGRLNGKSTSYGAGRVLQMPTQGLADQETVILSNINSRKVTLCNADSTALCEISFDGFSHLLLWSPDGQNALCIEPWQNLPDTDQNAQTEFAQKQGITKVNVGETSRLTRKIRYIR